jgi:hypothetical protein
VMGGEDVDEEAGLSVQQAHEKWITRMLIFSGLAVLLTIAFLVHDCNNEEKPCRDVTFNPADYMKIECPDRRQTLTTPPGWTWVRCSCPGK